jgi:hypothetical protein
MTDMTVYENYASQLHVVLKKYSEIVAVPELERALKSVCTELLSD